MQGPESILSHDSNVPTKPSTRTFASKFGEWLDFIAQQSRAHETLILALGVITQLAFLAAMGIPHASTVMRGETILLRVIPVDPRDLFRGDYVTLSYEISRVPDGGIDGMVPGRTGESDSEWRGRPVYVGLEPEEDGKHFRRTEVHFTPPPTGSYIRGTLETPWRITFGLESYYVQEGKGKAYEEAIREHKLSAVVALAPDGSASLRDLLIETD
jgi:uncharacterized membrane-anchored protein